MRTLQTNRALRHVKIHQADELYIPAMTDIATFAKQTQPKNEKDPLVEEMERGFAEIDRQAAIVHRELRARRAAEEAK